ncbi:MAG TPA: ATP-binding protein [Kofleriaceae bacterium]
MPTPTEYLVATARMVAHTLELRAREQRGDPQDAVLEAALASRKRNVAELAATIDTLPSKELQDRFGLTSHEMSTLWLLVAIASDGDARRFAAIVGEPNADPTSYAVQHIVFGETTEHGHAVLGPHGVLRRCALVERSDGGDDRVHESRRTWAIARRVLAWLHGDRRLDPELARFARIASHERTLDRLSISADLIAASRDALTSTNAVVVASGGPGSGRRSVLVAAAHEAGATVIEVDCARLPRDPAQLAGQLRSIARECKLLGGVPLLRNIDALLDGPDASRIELVGDELASAVGSAVLVTCGAKRVGVRWQRPVIALEVKSPSSAQRAALWRELIPGASETDGEHLATQYPLAPALMHAAAVATQARAATRKITAADIEAGVRAVLDDRLGAFAKRIEVTQHWDDLVLPDEHAGLVAELIARIRQRRTVYEQWGFGAKVGKGLGVTALFSGPPGTGKTMVASLIARELGLDLFQVDTGKLVSKWIGETEKHLGELFDGAEAGHAILLFDEADSLFGKRTEVRSSNDRYANLETNYLLQRLETFTGICLMTSNHDASIDPAFHRRLSLHLRFELPDAHERTRLWQAMLPASAPVEAGLDFGVLARRFAMSGGHIRNAALRAAFLAADEGSAIRQAHLEHAARVECESMGKIVGDVVLVS